MVERMANSGIAGSNVMVIKDRSSSLHSCSLDSIPEDLLTKTMHTRHTIR